MVWRFDVGRPCFIFFCLYVIQIRQCFADTAFSGTTSTNGPPKPPKTEASGSTFIAPTEPAGPPGSFGQPPSTQFSSPVTKGTPGEISAPGSEKSTQTNGPPSAPVITQSTSGEPATKPAATIRPPGGSAPQSTNPTNAANGPPAFGQTVSSKDDWTTRRWHTTTPPKPWTDDPSLYTADFSPIDFITYICPNTRFCKKQISADFSEPLETCCSECDCSDDCFAKGNCCHDKELPSHVTDHETPKSALNESCVFPGFGYSSMRELQSWDKKPVLIVNSCPYNSDLQSSEKDLTPSHVTCEHQEVSNLKGIMDLAPVYSTAKLVSYLNRECAMCNADISSLIPWERVTFSCLDLRTFSVIFSLTSSLESFLAIVKDFPCLMEFHPPHNNSVECLHQDMIISECNGGFSYNSKLIEYCQNVTVPFGRDGIFYKNVFCFGCNEFKQDIHSSACHNYMYGFGYEYEQPIGELNVEAIEEGLFVAAGNGSPNGSYEQCEEGFEYSEYLEQCVSYVCAPSKVNVNGTCLPFFKGLKNIGLDYKVTYSFYAGDSSIDKMKYKGLTENAVFNDSFQFSCHSKTKTIASLKDFRIIYVTLVTRAVKEMEDIEDEYMNFKERLAPLLNSREKFETTLDHEGFNPVPFELTDYVRFSDNEISPYCPESIAMVDMQFCDAVMFRTEANQLDDDRNLFVKSLKFKPSEYLIRTRVQNNSLVLYAHVCRDLLSNKVKDTVRFSDVSASRNRKPEVMFILLSAVFSIIYTQ